MKRYSIHSVAELLGVSADAIRLYEKDNGDTSVQADRYGTFADKENVWNRYI